MQNFNEKNCKNMSTHLYKAECALEGLGALITELENFSHEQ